MANHGSGNENIPMRHPGHHPRAAMHKHAGRTPHCVSICDPDMIDPTRYRANKPGELEMITQPLYDYQNYPAAGVTSLTFFQNPIGQSSKTSEDTNLTIGGQLPNPQKFTITAVSIDFLSGLAPVTFGAQSAVSQLNDMWNVLSHGVLTILIMEKNYLRVAPLLQFPPRSHQDAAVAVTDQTTAAAASQTKAIQAWVDGPVFKINPIMLFPSQNFNVNLSFPNGLRTLPSADANTRIGIHLHGLDYRAVQ